MATRSAIATVQKDGTVDAIYCHWDGYPEHHLPILTTEYNTASKARKLIAPGDISCLKTGVDWFGKPKDLGPLYYIDRGETGCDPRNMYESEFKQFAKNCGCEHIYIYTPRKGWKHEPVQI